jgi:hypothetical protein
MKNIPVLKIAEPCHENWTEMNPQEQGRHCDKCCKVVVDFTSMPTEKVIEFISERKAEKICGRFRSEQIIPDRVVPSSHSAKRYRIFFAALYFVFGGLLFASCKHVEEPTMGKISVEGSFGNGISQIPVVDTPQSRTQPRIDVKTKNPPVTGTTCIKTDTIEPEYIKMGEVEYMPTDTLK